MLGKRKTTLAVVAAAAVLAIGGAGAIAATGGLSPKEESDAVVGDAAEQLGVETTELTAALRQALKNRVDAAVAADRLTEEQGVELKARIDSDDYPLLGLGRGGPGGPGGPGHVHHFGGFDAAASYLGVTEEELRTELMEGQTLAGVAEAKGKSVDGLVDAMVAAAKQDLQQAVTDGRLTDNQRDEIVPTLEERITAKVNGELGPGRGGPGFGPPPGFERDEDDDAGTSSDSTSATSAA
jgi:hypothetical protein